MTRDSSFIAWMQFQGYSQIEAVIAWAYVLLETPDLLPLPNEKGN